MQQSANNFTKKTRDQYSGPEVSLVGFCGSGPGYVINCNTTSYIHLKTNENTKEIVNTW